MLVAAPEAAEAPYTTPEALAVAVAVPEAATAACAIRCPAAVAVAAPEAAPTPSLSIIPADVVVATPEAAAAPSWTVPLEAMGRSYPSSLALRPNSVTLPDTSRPNRSIAISPPPYSIGV